jgi:hypothetical protein
VRILNKRNTPASFVLELEHAPAGTHQAGFDGVIQLGPLGETVQPLILQKDRHDYTGSFRFKIRIHDAAGTFYLEREVEFLGPESRLLREEEEERHAAH